MFLWGGDLYEMIVFQVECVMLFIVGGDIVCGYGFVNVDGSGWGV